MPLTATDYRLTDAKVEPFYDETEKMQNSHITLGPIMIQTCSASQNDCLNFSFVKDTHVDDEKLARNGQKTTKRK